MNTPAKQGVRARERNALQRIEQLENDLQQIVGAVQNALQNLEGRAIATSEIVDAVVQEVGSEQVNSRIEANKAVKAQTQADQAKEALGVAVKEGKVVSAEVITDKSVITGIEYDKDNVVLQPGYVQLGMNTIKPEFQEKILGQKVGFKFETEQGSFEVTGIYDVVEVPAAEPAQNAPSTEVAQ